MVAMMDDKDSPVVTLPRRLDYFPPIAMQSTIYQRRKKKSAREIYQLSPTNPDFLSNPPSTPWAWDADPATDVFGEFIGTGLRRDISHHAAVYGGAPNTPNVSSLKTTWPFLRQIGPRCVFRGMRKKPRGDGDAEIAAFRDDGDVTNEQKLSSLKYKCNDDGNTNGTCNTLKEYYLGPKCRGISREMALQQHASSQHLNSEGVRRQVSKGHFKDGISPLSVSMPESPLSPPRGIHAPPPCGRCSGMRSDEPSNLPDNAHRHQERTPPKDVNIAKATYRIFYHPETLRNPSEHLKRKFRFSTEDQMVRFEQSPLPEKLQHLSNVTVTEPTQYADLGKVTWQDIVQAPVLQRGDIDYADDHGDPRQLRYGSKTAAHISFRLPTPPSRSGVYETAPAPSPASIPDQRSRGQRNDGDIATWIDDVRRAQSYDYGYSNRATTR